MAIVNEYVEPVPSEFLAICNECKAELTHVRLIIETIPEYFYVEGLGAVGCLSQTLAETKHRFGCLPCGHVNSYKVWKR